jgi:hypothetical protein
MEIRNLPALDSENFNNLLMIISNVSKTVGINFNLGDVRDVYRLPGRPGIIRPIVAEFTCVYKRNEFISAVRRYNKEKIVPEKLNTVALGLPGENRPIYVDEYLPPAQKKLFSESRKFAKTHNFSCWHSNGRILLRTEATGKPIQIKTVKCLDGLVKRI